MSATVRGPFSDEDVAALNARQSNPELHPYTCLHGHGALVPFKYGLYCPVRLCAYEQGWVYAADVRGDQ